MSLISFLPIFLSLRIENSLGFTLASACARIHSSPLCFSKTGLMIHSLIGMSPTNSRFHGGSNVLVFAGSAYRDLIICFRSVSTAFSVLVLSALSAFLYAKQVCCMAYLGHLCTASFCFYDVTVWRRRSFFFSYSQDVHSSYRLVCATHVTAVYLYGGLSLYSTESYDQPAQFGSEPQGGSLWDIGFIWDVPGNV